MGVFGTRKFFTEMREAEAVVDTLVQNTAELGVTLDQKDGPAAVFVSTLGSGEPCRTTTDDNDIVVSHTSTSLSFEESSMEWESSPDGVMRKEESASASRRKKRFEPFPS